MEALACQNLYLTPDTASTQVISRDVHAEFVQAMALLAASIERYAVEIRNLQRTDVLEVEEFFSKGQKGSSAMPHKRNPIRSERLSGVARIIRGTYGRRSGKCSVMARAGYFPQFSRAGDAARHLHLDPLHVGGSDRPD